MRRDEKHSPGDGEAANLKPEQPNRHDEAMNWARTPEMRAQEGVYASFREDQQVVREESTTREGDVDRDESATSSALVYDGSGPSLSAPHYGEGGSSSYVAYGDSSPSLPGVYDSCFENPVTTPSAPSSSVPTYNASAAASTQAAQPYNAYDYYQDERYDLHRNYLYDEDFLQDDYYYHNSYYHEDRYPHLYDQQTYSEYHHAAPSYVEPLHVRDPFAYQSHKHQHQESNYGVEAFASSAAVAAGAIWAGEHARQAETALSQEPPVVYSQQGLEPSQQPANPQTQGYQYVDAQPPTPVQSERLAETCVAHPGDYAASPKYPVTYSDSYATSADHLTALPESAAAYSSIPVSPEPPLLASVAAPHSAQPESILDNSVLQQLQNQPSSEGYLGNAVTNEERFGAASYVSDRTAMLSQEGGIANQLTVDQSNHATPLVHPSESQAALHYGENHLAFNHIAESVAGSCLISNQQDTPAEMLTSAPESNFHDGAQFLIPREIDAQPANLDVVWSNSAMQSLIQTPEGASYASLHALGGASPASPYAPDGSSHVLPNAPDGLSQNSVLADVLTPPSLQHHSAEIRGVQAHGASGLLINPDDRLINSKSSFIDNGKGFELVDASCSLNENPSAVAVLSNDSGSILERHAPAAVLSNDSEAALGSPVSASVLTNSTDAVIIGQHAVSEHGKREGAERSQHEGGGHGRNVNVNHGSHNNQGQHASDGQSSRSGPGKVSTVAGAAALGTLGFAGKVAQVGAKNAIGVIDFTANQLLKQDEDLARAAYVEDAVRDGILSMNRSPFASSDSMIEQLVSSEKPAGGATGKHAASSETASPKAKKANLREKPEAVNAKELLIATKDDGGTGLSAKPGLLEKGPGGLKSIAAEAGDHKGVEDLLIDKQNGGPGKKKKPATERERTAEKKSAARKAAKKEKNDSKAMSVVKQGGKAGMKGALFVGGVAASSTKNALSSRNEELAVAMSTVDKTKKAVNGVKTVARMPLAIYRHAKHSVMAVVNAVKHLFNFAATLTSLGPAGTVIALVLFFLFMILIAVLLGTASIINDEQEVSEVSALVAELDAELTEDIQALGDQPILYLDASDTYAVKGDGGKWLTKNADLADQESDLQEVVASSVTVQTDPGEVAAYIDAKYTGNWQVGAASWKYTIDAFGETWNVIEWDDMPEWAWKALNKVNRADFKLSLTEKLTNLLVDEFGLDKSLAGDIAGDTADEFANVIYDNQIQGINEDVLMQIIKDCVKGHKEDLDLSADQTRKLYYQMQQVISDLIGEEDPFAFVYDEITLLHERMNYWSEEYDSFEGSGIAAGGFAGDTGIALGTGSGGSNAYGYPNSSGYDPRMLSEWDGYNEVSVYGISEAGTTSVTADGTRITNTWADTNMGIACEGLQNYVFAYWSTDYKNATGITDGQPVKITLFNPATGLSVTAEVIDCGGWRGYNPRYTGMNADRQWDLLPAVWKALGGSESAGTMKVYWKVDPTAVVGTAAAEPKTIEGYPWPKETDEGDGAITITRPALVVHGVQDALRNDPLMEEIIDRDSFETSAEFNAVKTFVVTKVKDVMKTLLTMENSEGEEYVDYNYIRRNLGDPFGEDADGEPREWVITHRFNPGYEDFDEDEAYVEVKPLSDVKTVRAILKGEVEEVDDGAVTIRTYIDSANSSEVVYSNLTDIKVEEGDEIKRGQAIGKMADDVLRVSYYEINDAALQIETKKDWAYDPGLYMIGFAGYEAAAEPTEYIGATSDYSGCQTVVEFAFSRLGCPYVWGATGPNTFDCSGLTQWCYAQAGISIPRNSEAQHDAAAAAGNIIPLGQLQPGDILWKPGHVGIYIGNNQYIHAPRTGDVVKISGNATGYFSCGLRFG